MKNTDRELLELAAKAAGIEVRRGDGWQSDMLFRRIKKPSSPLVAGVHWNPLDDDGDALRLAVALKIDIALEAFEESHVMASKGESWWVEQYGDDMNAATRRAIVRAAAEIGKGMA